MPVVVSAVCVVPCKLYKSHPSPLVSHLFVSISSQSPLTWLLVNPHHLFLSVPLSHYSYSINSFVGWYLLSAHSTVVFFVLLPVTLFSVSTPPSLQYLPTSLNYPPPPFHSHILLYFPLQLPESRLKPCWLYSIPVPAYALNPTTLPLSSLIIAKSHYSLYIYIYWLPTPPVLPFLSLSCLSISCLIPVLSSAPYHLIPLCSLLNFHPIIQSCSYESK